MNLSDLYKRLARGELKNLALVEDGDIIESERETIVLHANEGLRKLYTRFMLKDDTLFLEQRGFLTSYRLSSKYAQSNAVPNAGRSFYINDLGRPFTDDLLKVMSVHDGFARRLPLNAPHEWLSVFTPQPTLLQIPHPVEGGVLSIQYQANHPKLIVTQPEQILELPEFLEKALCLFIGSEVFKNTNTQESILKGAALAKEFDTNCIELVEQDLVATGATTSAYRFEINGWV